MEQRTKKNLMLARITEIQRYLDDAITTGDPALLEELATKSREVLAVYHRKGRAVPPELFTFSDGITRNISRVAFECALATAYEEWNGETDFREFMKGQER